MSFHFTLKPLLTLRMNDRRLCEQAVAAARRHHSELVSAQIQITERRMELIGQIRQLNDGESLNVVQMTNLQRHVETLARDIERMQTEIDALAATVTRSVADLHRANLVVKALEKLQERKYADFQADRLKSELREVDDLIAHRSRR